MQLRLKPIAAALIFSAISGLLMSQGAQAVEIDAGELDAALHGLAGQTGIQVLFDANELKGVRTSGAHGAATPEQALKQLLQGTGYSFHTTGANSFVIRHLPEKVAVDERSRAELLPEVVVTATKTAASIREVPFAVSVVTADTIGQQSPKDISDILRREAGVDINRSTPLGAATVSVRGGDSASQRTQVLIDGQPSDFISTGVGGLTAIQIIDPLNVERVEIVRGAGSALYGPGAVGGVVNVITKRGDPDKPEVRFFAGADELGSNHLGFSGSGGDRVTGFTYRIAGKHSYYGGYKPAPAPTPNGNQSLQDIRDRESTAGGRLGFWLSARNELALTFNGQNFRGDSFGRPETRHVIRNGVLGLESNNWLSDTYLLSVAISQRSHRGDYDFDSFFYGLTR